MNPTMSPTTPHPQKKTNQLVAIIRLRGTINARPEIDDTLTLLKLYRRNYCVVYPKTSSILGMIHVVKDYVTWGEISSELSQQLQKQGSNGKENKPFYRLNSPRKGYGRKGIKVPFVRGGALGYRGEKIADLIQRMTS